MAYRDIPRGVVWASAIVDALEDSSMMVVAFSESFNQSKQVDREIELASEDDKPILTFRLSESKFSGAKRYYLKNLNWIDAFPNPDGAFGELYKNICKLLGKEEPVPITSNSNQRTHTGRASSEDSTNQVRSLTNQPQPQKHFQSNSLTTQPGLDSGKREISHKADNKPDHGFINGHEWVDLGLPSGLKWATCNVGASSPEDCGSYYAWGEIRTKSSYERDNCQTVSGRFLPRPNDKENLSFSFDAARYNWGGTWRMPTLREIRELVANTTKEWTTKNGVNGLLVRSKNNGNSIFLPAGGRCEKSSIPYKGERGYYWSSTPDIENARRAHYHYVNSDSFNSESFYRFYGRLVRPVSE